MTAHVHDHRSTDWTPDAPPADPPADPAPSIEAAERRRPRWLVPAGVAGLIVGGLVVTGVLSPAVVLYGGLAGGCLLMHLVGGHGGHGGHGGGSSGGTRHSH